MVCNSMNTCCCTIKYLPRTPAIIIFQESQSIRIFFSSWRVHNFASKARHHLLDHKRDCHTNKAYIFNIPQKQTKTKRKKQIDLILLQKQATLDIQANKVLMKPLTNPSNCKKQTKQAEFPSNNRLQNSTWVPDWHTDWQAGSVGDAARHCSSLSLSGFLQSSTGQSKREDDEERFKRGVGVCLCQF